MKPKFSLLSSDSEVPFLQIRLSFEVLKKFVNPGSNSGGGNGGCDGGGDG